VDDADAVELRVLGCLIEKQRTTPDVYPLSLNALRLACNQSTNRDPVVEYDEATLRPALASLSRRGWVRLTSGPGSRAAKYRQMLDQALQLDGEQTAILCVLLLRGAQTPGELKQRSERMHRFASLDEIEQQLEQLISRDLVERLPRRPGQKEERYLQLLGNPSMESRTALTESEPEPALQYPPERVDVDLPIGGVDRLSAVEREVRELREEIAALRATLEELRR
jgi:uncharacterized protein YceH (UPF0502 family)